MMMDPKKCFMELRRLNDNRDIGYSCGTYLGPGRGSTVPPQTHRPPDNYNNYSTSQPG